METIQNWIDSGPDRPLKAWFHGLDVLAHCLKADFDNSAWGCPEETLRERTREGSLSSLRAWIEGYSEKRLPGFDDIAREVYSRPRKRSRDILGFEGDALDVDAYVSARAEGEDLNEVPVWTDENRVTDRRKMALSLVFGGEVPWVERKKTYMRDRQRQAYQICLQCEQERRPVRVVAAYASKFSEAAQPIVFYVVVKDWNDPVFPALWGAYQDNAVSNDFSAVQSFAIVGTKDIRAGSPVRYNIAPDFVGEEVQLLGPAGLTVYEGGM